jgi:5'-nucleotidase
VDFSTAAHFTAYFARLLLEKRFPKDVALLKVDVPSNATPSTPWQVTRVASQRYYEPLRPKRESWDEPERVGYHRVELLGSEQEGSDVYVLRSRRLVSVTPISLDLTSRVDFEELDRVLRA